MIDVSREPNLTLWSMMTMLLLAEAMKSMIRSVGRGKLNMVSIHLITEDVRSDTYQPTPSEVERQDSLRTNRVD